MRHIEPLESGEQPVNLLFQITPLNFLATGELPVTIAQLVHPMIQHL